MSSGQMKLGLRGGGWLSQQQRIAKESRQRDDERRHMENESFGPESVTTEDE